MNEKKQTRTLDCVRWGLSLVLSLVPRRCVWKMRCLKKKSLRRKHQCNDKSKRKEEGKEEENSTVWETHCLPLLYLFMVFLTYKILCTRFFFSFDFKINPFMLFMHLTRKCHPSLTSFWLFFSTSNRLRSCLEKMRWKAICGSVHTSCP